jgi:hypothetical protein
MIEIKKLKLIFCLFFIFSISNLSAQQLEFETSSGTNGTAFYAIDKTTGQISVMLDYYSKAGKWENYGGIIERDSLENNLSFCALKTKNGMAFFSMDGTTGQVYMMLDYYSNAGKWESYGGTLPSSAKGYVGFQVDIRTKGFNYYAMDGDTGQVYLMLDYYSNAGKWESYGGTIPK